MKLWVSILTTLFAVSPFSYVHGSEGLPGCSKQSLRCAVHVGEQPIHAGDALLVEVTCENASQERIRLKQPLSFECGVVWCEIKRPDASDFQEIYTTLTGVLQLAMVYPLYLDPKESVVTRLVLATGWLGEARITRFFLDRPGTYQIRAGVRYYDGACYSDPVTFTVNPASTKMERYIRAAADLPGPEEEDRDPEFSKLVGIISALSPSGGAGLGWPSDVHRMQEYVGNEKSYQPILLIGETSLLLCSKDSAKQAQGIAKLEELLRRQGLDTRWKQVVMESKAFHLAKLGRDAEAKAILKEIKHESEITHHARACLPGGGREMKEASTQPAQNNSQKQVPTAIITVPEGDS